MKDWEHDKDVTNDEDKQQQKQEKRMNDNATTVEDDVVDVSVRS